MGVRKSGVSVRQEFRPEQGAPREVDLFVDPESRLERFVAGLSRAAGPIAMVMLVAGLIFLLL